ncbi:glyoxalase [Actinotalea ferrariae CF5-4]|uniref:Glyoxalase n=1 Tax=Actinotalea ferrariae CF5-4 TaxID=948458 RepID=A0A021VY47_9CELL|nr:VOC family protein [Actinotalea ferrariae]EYR64920.1 glyoxalase [Actinotalea ferrariae CF5-4]
MLSDFPAMPVLAVTDLDRARRFYEDTLGLSPGGEAPDGVVYRAGGVDLLVYPSAYAGTNKATAVGFQLPEDAFDDEVARLRERGVDFQEFEMEGLTWRDGVAEMEGMRSVWFADPDGNILNIGTPPAAG